MAHNANNQAFISPSRLGTYFLPDRNRLCQFARSSILVVTLWPFPRAWRKTKKAGWIHSRADIQIPHCDCEKRIAVLHTPTAKDGQFLLPFLDSPHRACLSWLRLYNTVPSNVRELVSIFSTSSHWNMLSFLARVGKPAEELIVSNPALAFVVAHGNLFRIRPVQRPHRAARSLLKKQRRATLEAFGFPPTRSIARILAKLPPQACTIRHMFYLRGALGEPKVLKKLQHAPRLTTPVIRVVTDPNLQPLASPRLIEEIGAASESEARRISQMLDDVRSLLRSLTYPTATAQPINSISQLQSRYSELVAVMDDAWGAPPNSQQVACIQPPINGTGCIQPIMSYDEMEAESRLQDNCVGEKRDEVVRRKAYFYRVDLPWERATLSLVRKANEWRFGDLRARENGPVCLETWRHVKMWLDAHNISARRSPRLVE